jgi:hypothetical protein
MRTSTLMITTIRTIMLPRTMIPTSIGMIIRTITIISTLTGAITHTITGAITPTITGTRTRTRWGTTTCPATLTTTASLNRWD